MQDIYYLLIGIVVLFLGIPVGDLLAKSTKEELKSGKKYFRIITLISLLGALISLFTGKDYLLFSFLFIAVVTSRSIK